MNGVYAIQCFFLQQYIGLIMCTFAILRASLYMSKTKNKFIQSIYCPILLSILAISLALITATLSTFHWYDILPVASTLSIIWSTWQDGLITIRIVNIFSCTCYLIFDIIILAYFAVVSDIICILANIIAIVINDILPTIKKHNKKEKLQELEFINNTKNNKNIINN